MGIAERPPLDSYTCEKIDAELHGVDTRHWPQITAMRVKNYHSPDEPVPPQRPEHLLFEIKWYADGLFKTEADYYEHLRADPRYGTWLASLADRVRARVMKALERLESGGTNLLERAVGIKGAMILGYHGLTAQKVEEQVNLILLELRRQYQPRETPAEPISAKIPPSQLPIQAVPKKSLETDQQETFAEALNRLLIEARWKPEYIADKIGLDPRNVYRHLSGETKPTLENLGLYETALSKHLARPVKLPTPAKRQRASKTSAFRQ